MDTGRKYGVCLKISKVLTILRRLVLVVLTVSVMSLLAIAVTLNHSYIHLGVKAIASCVVVYIVLCIITAIVNAKANDYKTSVILRNMDRRYEYERSRR